MMRKEICPAFIAIVLIFLSCNSLFAQQIDLSGTWKFRIDSLDAGMFEKWFTRTLDGSIKLPGSLTTNNIGDEITVNTPWTGSIIDSSWFFDAAYAPYREPGNIKVPFWLQPIKYYKGAAWYQKEINIPASWSNKHIELFLERCHWETKVWVDEKPAGTRNALGAPHIYDLTSLLSPGRHRITICIDNRVKDVNVGINSHSISDHTQSNWNGVIGKMQLTAKPHLFIDEVRVYPDIEKKQVIAAITYKNETGGNAKAQFNISVTGGKEKLKKISESQAINDDSGTVSITFPMGKDPLLWDEFHANLYRMQVEMSANGSTDSKEVSFGMREFTSTDKQLLINGRPVFLRGTLECAVFPLTGYPSTDPAYWRNIFKVSRSYGLNHLRFHSWCPPEVAFDEADKAGFYLQVECSSWANQGAVIGDGTPLDKFIYAESERIVKAFGNHPSFVMMAYGNEPAGKNHVKYLTEFVQYWQKKDPRRIYTTGAGWPVVDENDYNNTPDPRIQHWGAGLTSIINSKPPQAAYDWDDVIAKWKHPTVSHEIGQWCVYPDFKETALYTGVLKAKNFDIFKETLAKHGLAPLADSFLKASGRLQVLCYKADIEAAFRTKDFGGFQLLGLNDFPGQGTALVGVVNAFWKDKGYVTGEEFSRFCNATVPLARFPKMIYLNDEALQVPVEIAHYGQSILENVKPSWNIKNATGKILFSGELPQATIPIGNGYQLGKISQSLSSIHDPSKLTLTVTVGKHENSWTLFVYPAKHEEVKGVFVTDKFDDEAKKILNDGGKVLLTVKKGSVKKEKGGDVAVGFSSIFWNTAWTKKQPPHTLGILCDPKHPALKYFPTDYYSSWQWWDAMSHSDAMILDSVSTGLQPIVRVIDDWVTARPLGLAFECRVGKGRLIVSSIDLLTNADSRPEARQLRYSLEKYMTSGQFNPQPEIEASKIEGLFN
jgi:hypothetical protein